MPQQQNDLFGGPTVDDVTLTDMLDEVERELAMRRSAYPRWVGSGSMTQEKADRQTLVLEAVKVRLQREARRERG